MCVDVVGFPYVAFLLDPHKVILTAVWRTKHNPPDLSVFSAKPPGGYLLPFGHCHWGTLLQPSDPILPSMQKG